MSDNADLTADGWEVTLQVEPRTVSRGTKTHHVHPTPPCFLPDSLNYYRGGRQRFLIMANYNYTAHPTRAVVAVCKELRLHTPEERMRLVENVAALCDMKLGETND